MGFTITNRDAIIIKRGSDELRGDNIPKQMIPSAETYNLHDLVLKLPSNVSEENKEVTKYSEESKAISFLNSASNYDNVVNVYTIQQPYSRDNVNIPLRGTVPYMKYTTTPSGDKTIYTYYPKISCHNKDAVARSDVRYDTEDSLPIYIPNDKYGDSCSFTVKLNDDGKLEVTLHKGGGNATETLYTASGDDIGYTTMLVEIQASGANGDGDDWDNGGGNSGCYALFSIDVSRCDDYKYKCTLGYPNKDGAGGDSYLEYSVNGANYKWTIMGGLGGQPDTKTSYVTCVSGSTEYKLTHTPLITGWTNVANHSQAAEASNMTQSALDNSSKYTSLMQGELDGPCKLLFMAAGGPAAYNTESTWHYGDQNNLQVNLNDLTASECNHVKFPQTTRGNVSYAFPGAGSFLGTGGYCATTWPWTYFLGGPGAGGSASTTQGSRQGVMGLINIYFNV